MATWTYISDEIEQAREYDDQPYDSVRLKYLESINQYTKRNTILYATNWTTPIGIPIDPNLTSISEEDIQGFTEVVHGLDEDKLDLILHSPGGSLEATEAIVLYLRAHFSDIRVIIPYAAMSTATMLACAANKIIMGNHSFLGPICPQKVLRTPLGNQSFAAQDIIDQFGRARKECQDEKSLRVWYPTLDQYGPALLIQCENAISLSKTLVLEWLQKYMFDGRDAATISQSIASF